MGEHIDPWGGKEGGPYIQHTTGRSVDRGEGMHTPGGVGGSRKKPHTHGRTWWMERMTVFPLAARSARISTTLCAVKASRPVGVWLV